MDNKLILFDSNGNFGKGIKPNPFYNDIPELIAQMDRLGISKSLVWYTEARDFNTTGGNNRLLKELKKAGVQDRLIPAFTISPTMIYEEGAMDQLVHGMLEHNVHALRAFPGSIYKNRFLEPILDEVRKLKPVLFFDSKDGVHAEDLLALAEKYPEMPMVYMQGMWGELLTMLDLLRRRDNILIDNSWLHTPEAIEMVVDRFGEKRILFGTGYRSHNGASIAALQHAEISEAARRSIACKNLEELLGDNALAAASPVWAGSHGRQDSLWQRFIDKNGLNTEIIDAHVHLGPSSASVIKQNTIRKQVGYLQPVMDSLGIKHMVASSMQALFGNCPEGNIAMEKELADIGDKRFSGYLGFNPIYENEMIPLLDGFFSRGFYIGFKLLCDYWNISLKDQRFKTVWEYADKYRLPILMHTWEGSNNSPALLKDIAGRYPDAYFLLGHSGGGNEGRREAVELAQENSNVYLEFCGSFTSSILWEETINDVGADRVVFGSDTIFHNPFWELGRLLSVDVPEEMLCSILSGNMKRILSMRKHITGGK